MKILSKKGMVSTNLIYSYRLNYKMKIETDLKLDYSDVLFRPKRSDLSSRKQVDLERSFTFRYSNAEWRGIPIFASNMDTIGTVEMFKSLSKYKMITCLHKFIDIVEVVEACLAGCEADYFALSTGITDSDIKLLDERVRYCHDNGVDVKFICVDVANGYMSCLPDVCKQIRNKYPNITLIAGSVVTREMTEELILNGHVDIVRVGIGSGSVCTTRLQTGVGMPQLSAVMECSDAAHGLGAHIIADGGVVVPGDVSKAIGGGADFVMMGGMLSAHTECGGDIVEVDGVKYKSFYGMSSSTAMEKYYGGVAKHRSSEGKEVKLKYKGDVSHTIDDLLGGMRSTCTYVGAKKLKDLCKCTTFLRVTNQVNTVYN